MPEHEEMNPQQIYDANIMTHTYGEALAIAGKAFAEEHGEDHLAEWLDNCLRQVKGAFWEAIERD